MLGQLLFFLAALARLVVVGCGAESCFCYGVFPVFIFVLSVIKHLPCHLFNFVLKQWVIVLFGLREGGGGGVRYRMPR